MKLEEKKKGTKRHVLAALGARFINHCTLRARAETSWCQSRNFVYLGLKT